MLNPFALMIIQLQVELQYCTRLLYRVLDHVHQHYRRYVMERMVNLLASLPHVERLHHTGTNVSFRLPSKYGVCDRLLVSDIAQHVLPPSPPSPVPLSVLRSPYQARRNRYTKSVLSLVYYVPSHSRGSVRS